MAFLPISKEDLRERNIDELDLIMVSGDAYVDHHSFGHAVIARLFEALGFSVGIIAQPVQDADYLRLGRPKLGFLVSSGVVDSMVNLYSVAKKRRSEDSYSPGGKAGRRPDRALTVYCRKLKTLFPDSPVVIGGIEASLRRFAHYDYWKDEVMPSVLSDTEADLMIYGLGERPVMEIASRLQRGIPLGKIRDVRGTAYYCAYEEIPQKLRVRAERGECVFLPSFEDVRKDKRKFAEAFYVQSRNTDAVTAKCLLQKNGTKYVVQNLPQFPLEQKEMDFIYALPYERDYHPTYRAEGGIPAIEEVKFSIVSQRGCFGSCSFCALNYHQGRHIEVRSDESILEEAEHIVSMPDFKGYIHDVGGPTANFHAPACEKQKTAGVCENKYCIGAEKCAALKVDHSGYLRLLRKLRKIPGVKKVFIRSGVRYDYIMYDPDDSFLRELIRYHISGQLKIAPEHISDDVLKRMNKPPSKVYLDFAAKFEALNRRYGMKQYLVPYFISSHPGCKLTDAIDLTLYLKSIGYMPQQVQDFYPTPSTRATCMYYTGIDPDTGEKVYVPKDPHEKRMQRALLQYRKPENAALVREALTVAGRTELIPRILGNTADVQSALPQAYKASVRKTRTPSKGGTRAQTYGVPCKKGKAGHTPQKRRRTQTSHKSQGRS